MRRVLTRTEKEKLLVNKLSELEVRWGRKPIYDRSEIPWIAHSSDEEIEKAIIENVLAPLDH